MYSFYLTLLRLSLRLVGMFCNRVVRFLYKIPFSNCNTHPDVVRAYAAILEIRSASYHLALSLKTRHVRKALSRKGDS